MGFLNNKLRKPMDARMTMADDGLCQRYTRAMTSSELCAPA